MTSLALLQLVSPSLPVGAFSYSEGLESLVQDGRLSDEISVFSWLEAELQRGQLRIEAAFQTRLRSVLKEWKTSENEDSRSLVCQMNYWLLALRDSSEIREQQCQMGRSLLQLLAEIGHPLPDGRLDMAWPVAWAWACLAWHLSELEAVEGYLYSWVANQLSAAVRLVPLGPTKAQAIQSRLLPLIQTEAKYLLHKDPDDIWTGDVGATMAQLYHAELYSRLFRS